MRSRAWWIVPCVLLLSTAARSADREPVAVSPGSGTGALIGDDCPTFSWGQVEGAEAYELVVYRLGEEGEEARPVMRRAVAGSASAWTPSLDLCLERGGEYAWSVRALTQTEASDWSRPSIFRVADSPSLEQIARALVVLEDYLRASERNGGTAEAEDPTLPERAQGFRGSAGQRPEPRSLATAAAALWAELPDTEGEVYGVAGIAHSPQGAGLVAQNTSTGADLVLVGDGASPDSRLTESGLECTSEEDETFSFSNLGAGGMTLAAERLAVDADGLAVGGTQLVTSGGKVGVGIGDPFAKLEIEAESGVMPFLARTGGNVALEVKPAGPEVYASNLHVGGKVGIGLSNPFAKFEIEAASGVMPLLARTGGNVALEVKPTGPEVYTSNLHVGGKAGIGLSDPFAKFEIEAGSGVMPLIVRSGGTVALEVRPAGAMGPVPEVFAYSLLVGGGGGLVVQGDATVDGSLGCTGCVGPEDLDYGCGTYHSGCTAGPGGTLWCPCPFDSEAGWGGDYGPACDQVPVGAFCESDGECGLSDTIDNCGTGDWYLRIG